MEIIHLNWKEFSEQYEPIKNIYTKNAECDGFLFGEIDQLENVPKERVWTLMFNPDNADMYITNGYRMINSVGWLTTRIAFIPDEVIEVRLEDGYEINENYGEKDSLSVPHRP